MKKYLVLSLPFSFLLILFFFGLHTAQPVHAAVVPPVPGVTNRTTTTIDVHPNYPNNTDQLAVYKEEGISCDGSGGSYIAASGSDNGATAVWQVRDTWGTKTVTGLNQEKMYSFCVKARDPSSLVETAFSTTTVNSGGYFPISGHAVFDPGSGGTGCCSNRYSDASGGGRYICGVDNGTTAGGTNTAQFQVKSGTFTLLSNESLVASSLDLSGGEIAIPVGALIMLGQNKPMWVIDADADGYPASQAMTVSAAKPGPTYKRRAEMTTMVTTDCNDNNYSLANTCCNPLATACSAGSECCSGFCVDGVCCNTACNTANCQKCNSLSNAGSGTCGYITTQTDPDNECSAVYNACSGNNRIGPNGNCSGTSAACKSDGLSSACTTASTCQTGGGCSGGSCISVTNQSYGQDLYGQCTASYNNCSGSNRIGPDGNCNGSGACNTTGLSSACATASTCQTGGGCSGGSCISVTNQSNGQDLYSQCPPAGVGNECATGTCNGSGACAGIDPGFEGLCAACKVCGGGTTCVNVSNNTQDNTGSNLCNSTCQKCSSGSCINQTAAEDLFNQCPHTQNYDFTLANNGSGNSCNTMCSWYMCNTYNCSGTGASCNADHNCLCASVGTDAGGTNSTYYYNVSEGSGPWCVSDAASCSTTLSGGNGTCNSRSTNWTNCHCTK